MQEVNQKVIEIKKIELKSLLIVLIKVWKMIMSRELRLIDFYKYF
jgi:hypothetical protein